jgi:GntR family transcriptional regulator/MocR family aminotransferase
LKRPPKLVVPPVPLDTQSPVPLFRQIHAGLRDAILAGRLAPGARLPSSRSLANKFCVSRNTVLCAYAELVADGLAIGQVGSGTRVLLRSPRVRRPTAEQIVAQSGYPRTALSFQDPDGNALFAYR